ncbi:AbiTii domain-containing protein [Klebsiella aerogenes]
MSLLREIQQAAIDPSIALPSLLRKCKVLASWLGNQEFKQWINFELKSYPGREELPDYRIFNVRIHGDFTGEGGSTLSDAEIHEGAAPKEIRKHLFTCELTPSVATIAALLQDHSHGAKYPLDLRTSANFSDKVYEGMICLGAWKVIPANQLIGIIDIIKTKILDFALEIETENPEAGEASVNTQPIPQEKVQQVFNTYINGNGNNIATASQHVSQEANNTDTHAEVFSQLLDALCSVNDESIKIAISTTVEEMRAAKDKASFKTHYTQFISLLADHMQILGTVTIPCLR